MPVYVVASRKSSSKMGDQVQISCILPEQVVPKSLALEHKEQREERVSKVFLTNSEYLI